MRCGALVGPSPFPPSFVAAKFFLEWMKVNFPLFHSLQLPHLFLSRWKVAVLSSKRLLVPDFPIDLKA